MLKAVLMAAAAGARRLLHAAAMAIALDELSAVLTFKGASEDCLECERAPCAHNQECACNI